MSDWRPGHTAPMNCTVIAWSGGVRLMRQDDFGQWRNMLGRPKDPPTHWMPLPEKPLSDGALGCHGTNDGQENRRQNND